MRISCASFVRIRSSDGRFALLVNKSQLKQGKKVLVPVGGAIQVSAAEGHAIMRRLNLNDSDFDSPPTSVVDLRFTVDDTLVPEVRRLFPTWDADPSRELYEELVDETDILTKAEFKAANFTLRPVGVGEETAVSTRSGQGAGQKTLRLVSIFDLSCTKEILAKLEGFGLPIVFVTAKEIKAEQSKTGAKIASISKTLLAPKRQLS